MSRRNSTHNSVPRQRRASTNSDYDVPDTYIHLSEISAPSPVENPQEDSLYRHESLEERLDADSGRRHSKQRSTAGSPEFSWFDSGDDSRQQETPIGGDAQEELERSVSRQSRPSRQGRHGRRGSQLYDVYDVPEEYANLNETVSPLPVENPEESRIYRHNSLEEYRSNEARQQSIPGPRRLSKAPQQATAKTSKPLSKGLSKAVRHVSRNFTELYTISYLVVFAILGTLARLGLDALTIYSGAPITFSVLWANFAGSLFLGFLKESSHLFTFEALKERSGNNSGADPTESRDSSSREAQSSASQVETDGAHSMQKPIPLYIGLSTGFCGSFTSFSSFIRDMFLALSNTLLAPRYHEGDISMIPTPRVAGFDVMATLAILLVTLCMSLSALKLGAHIAIAVNRYDLRLSDRTNHFLDRLAVLLAIGMWAGAIVMAVLPPDRPSGPQGRDSWEQESWRGLVLFAICLAPVGCLLRFYTSLKLNDVFVSFPLGTFIANVFGTAVLGMAWDLQRVPLSGSLIGGGIVSCQVLQGVMDGFCGCLTTVSTWVMELSSLRRRHGYLYGLVSVVTSLALLIVIMGTLKWTVGWKDPVCMA